MKDIQIRRVTWALAAAGMLTWMSCLAGCGRPSMSGTPKAEAQPNLPSKNGSAEKTHALQAVRVLGKLPWFSLTDQDGKAFGTDQLRGKVWVATFIFTRCGSTCPQQTAQFRNLQQQIRQEKGLEDVHLVSITVDPDYDKAQVLKSYGEQFGANSKYWSLLTGSRPDIWGLVRYDFRLPVTESPDDASSLIAHSQKFVLVDRLGRLRSYYDGLSEKDLAALKRDMQIVLEEPLGNPRSPDAPKRVAIPEEILDPPWMAERGRYQREHSASFEVFHDFQFVDRYLASGIRFEHQIVDDGGKLYKAVHYDHGNGLAIADVDGDGDYDIYFTTQLGANELWQNLGDGTFKNITKKAGVGVEDRISVTASFADVDNDGDPDLFVTTVRGGNRLFENLGNGRFGDISKSAGLDYVGHSSGAIFFDYDRDGLLDLLVTNVGIYTTDEQGAGGYFVGFKDAFAGHLKPERAEPSLLYHNNGDKTFVDVSEKVGFVDASWSGDASPLDLNDDGWPDILLLNMQGHDEYYENVKGKKFVKKSREVFPKTPWGSMGVKVFDFDNDGKLDIYVTDMHTDMADVVLGIDQTGTKRPWEREKNKMVNTYPDSLLNTDLNHVLGNAFYRNLGDGKFEEISDKIGAETFWPWGLSVGDLNADGFEDAFVTGSMNFEFRYGVNSVLLNNRGKTFLDSEFIVGVEPRRGGRTAKPWFQLDCFGADRSNFFCSDNLGRWEMWGALGSRSSVIFDMDDDGDLDIVTNEFNSEPQVLVSDLSQKLPEMWHLKIRLVGTRSNRDGLGAQVRLKAGSTSQLKMHDGKSGYLAQSSGPLYFGLGKTNTVDEIEIRWPSGTRQRLAGPIKANQLLEIREPDQP